MKIFSLLTLIFVLLLAEHTEVVAQTGNRHWIEFTDKNNSPYSLNNPSAYLSARAIQRRVRQNIAIDSSDLPVNPHYIDSLISKGALIRNRSRWLNGVTVEASPAQLAQIQALPFVKRSSPNGRIVLPASQKMQATPWLPSQRTAFTPAQYGDSYNQIALHKGDVLHNAGFRGEGMLIAVFDAGFTNVNTLACFDSLRLQGKIKDTWDFVDLNSNVYGFDSHGTYVLGCMAGWIPGSLIGTAPKADYMLYRTENNVGGSEYIIEEDNWVAGAERADSAGADVFNTSLSYTTFDDPSMNHTYADLDGNTTRITRGADKAASKGIMVVVSAGNYGGSSWQYIGAPADGDSVLAVGATDANGNRVGFSSIGPTSDGRIKPNVMAQGSAAVSCGLQNGITTVSGTSFSGPIMAGLVSCLWQAFPEITNMQLMQAVQNAGNMASTPNNQVGYGIPDFQAARQALSVNELNQQQFNLLAYPNPVDRDFQLAFRSTQTGLAKVSLTDLQGKVLLNLDYTITKPGAQLLELRLPEGVESGIYLIGIEHQQQRNYLKLLKP